MAQSYKPINKDLRPVPGGFVQRVNLGDTLHPEWKWRAYGPEREPISPRLAFPSEKAAAAAVLAEMDPALSAFVARHKIRMTVEPVSSNLAMMADADDETESRWAREATHYRCSLWIGDAPDLFTCHFSQGSAHVEPPTVVAVLDALGNDAQMNEQHATFEDFAREYGYNPDSRRHERQYRAGREQMRRFKAWLGSLRFRELMASWEEE